MRTLPSFGYGMAPGNCLRCTQPKKHAGHGYCNSCLRAVKRQTMPHFYLGTCYSEIKRRCTSTKHNSSKNYTGLPLCSRDEFLKKFIKDTRFLVLFKEWQQSGFQKKCAPSIDRIVPSLGYVLDNLQFISQSENSFKDQKKTPIEVFDKNGMSLGQFPSIGKGSKVLGVSTADLFHWLNETKKCRKGWIVRRLE